MENGFLNRAFQKHQEGAWREGIVGAPIGLGPQPFNRDNAFLAFGKYAAGISKAHGAICNGQLLAGTGALVFEGELLDLPARY